MMTKQKHILHDLKVSINFKSASSWLFSFFLLIVTNGLQLFQSSCYVDCTSLYTLGLHGSECEGN